MKTVKLSHLLRVALVLTLGLFLVNGCSKPQEEEKPVDKPVEKPEEKPTPEPVTWDMKAIVESPVVDCEILTAVNPNYGFDIGFKSTWNESPYLMIWAKQDNELFYIDRIYASQFTEERLKAVYEFKISSQLNFDKPFTIYGLKDGKQVATNLYYQCSLRRAPDSFDIFFKASAKQGEVELMGSIAGTNERLYFINKTNNPVQVRHKGFSAEKPWYYTYADVSVEDGSVINAEQGDEVSSKVVNAQPFNGNNACRINSYYAPNGNKITDARLILEIDGKEVRSTNRLSSNVTLQTSHSYAMIVTWDGSELRFEEAAGIIDVSTSEIDFGTVAYGAEKTERFTVRNQGTAPISIRVSNGDCPSFDVTDNGQEFTLNGGESKEYAVTAFGMKRNSQAYCDLQVNTNAENGKQVVRVRSSGWDNKPLTLETSEITLPVGGIKQVNVVFGGLDCDLANSRPDVAIASFIQSTQSGGGRYDSSTHTFLIVNIEAKMAGTTYLTITDKETKESAELIVHVTGNQ